MSWRQTSCPAPCRSTLDLTICSRRNFLLLLLSFQKLELGLLVSSLDPYFQFCFTDNVDVIHHYFLADSLMMYLEWTFPWQLSLQEDINWQGRHLSTSHQNQVFFLFKIASHWPLECLFHLSEPRLCFSSYVDEPLCNHILSSFTNSPMISESTQFPYMGHLEHTRNSARRQWESPPHWPHHLLLCSLDWKNSAKSKKNFTLYLFSFMDWLSTFLLLAPLPQSPMFSNHIHLLAIPIRGTLYPCNSASYHDD